MKRLTTALVALFALAQVPAFAQQGPGQMGAGMTPEQRAARFEAGDTNKDGKLDKAEWLAQVPQRMKANATEEQLGQMWSARLDADGNGSITKEEYLNMRMGRPGGQ